VVQLLHQQPLAAHRIEDCNSNARSSRSGAIEGRPSLEHSLPNWGDISLNLIHQGADLAQRMVTGHTLVRGNVAEHLVLLLVGSSHIQQDAAEMFEATSSRSTFLKPRGASAIFEDTFEIDQVPMHCALRKIQHRRKQEIASSQLELRRAHYP